MDDTFRHQDSDHRASEAGDVTETFDSATLARLMAEVRNGGDTQPTAYNRMHNRHNRS